MHNISILLYMFKTCPAQTDEHFTTCFGRLKVDSSNHCFLWLYKTEW